MFHNVSRKSEFGSNDRWSLMCYTYILAFIVYEITIIYAKYISSPICDQGTKYTNEGRIAPGSYIKTVSNYNNKEIAGLYRNDSIFSICFLHFSLNIYFSSLGC